MKTSTEPPSLRLLHPSFKTDESLTRQPARNHAGPLHFQHHPSKARRLRVIDLRRFSVTGLVTVSERALSAHARERYSDWRSIFWFTAT